MAVYSYVNNAESHTVSSLTISGTTIVVTAGDGELFAGSGNIVATLADGNESQHEIVLITGRSGDALTVVRAQENTAAVAWGAGTKIEARVTAGMLDYLDPTYDDGSTAIGEDAIAGSGNTTVVGKNATALDSNAIAVGYNSTAEGLNSIAVGPNTDISPAADYATVLGSGATATAASALALGASADATGTSAVAVGDSTTASAAQSLAAGKGATASGGSAIAVGDTASASAAGAVAVGGTSAASAQNAVAVGKSTVAGGVDSVAVGRGASATTNTSVAVGPAVSNSSIAAVTVGATSSATTSAGAIVVGSAASANAATKAIVVGENSSATTTSTGAVVVGGDSDAASSIGVVVVGADISVTNAEESVVVGHAATVDSGATNSVVVGGNTRSAGTRGVAIGFQAGARAKYSTALGADAETYVESGFTNSSISVVQRESGLFYADTEHSVIGLTSTATVIASPPMELSVGVSWATTTYQDGDVVKPTSPSATEQFYLVKADYDTDFAADNTVTEAGSQPTWSTAISAGQGGTVDAAVGGATAMWVYIDPEVGVDIQADYLGATGGGQVMFFPRRVGFVCLKYGAHSVVPSVSVGNQSSATAYVNNQALSAITAANMVQWFELSSAAGASHVVFTLDAVGTGASSRMMGRFVVEGVYMQLPG